MHRIKLRKESSEQILKSLRKSPVLIFISKEGHRVNISLADDSPSSGKATVDWIEYTRIVYNSSEIAARNRMLSNFALLQNYPNPFNPVTLIKYELKKTGTVSLKIFDQLGKEIAVLVDEEKPAGTYEAKFDGKQLSSGIYFYQLSTDDFKATRKLMLMK